MTEQRVELVITGNATGVVGASRRTDEALQRLGRSVRPLRLGFDDLALSVGRTLGAFAGLAGAGLLARTTRNVIRSTAALSEQAAVVGLTAESYQELTKAFADLGGVSEGVTTGALRRFNRRLGLAAEGAGAAKDTFGELGIAIRDATGNLRGTEEVLEESLKELAAIENAARRAAQASEVFGEDAGPRLAAVLGQGTEALDESIRELREAGRVMTDEAAEAARELNDEYNRIADTLNTRFKSAVVGTADLVRESLGNWQAFFGLDDNAELRALQSDLERLASRRDRILENLDTSPWPDQLRDSLRDVNQEMLATQRRIQELQTGGVTRLPDVTVTGSPVSAPTPAPSTPGELMLYPAKDIYRQIELDAATIASIVERNLTPLERYQEGLDQVQRLMAQGLGADTATREIKRLNEEFITASAGLREIDRESEALSRTARDLGFTFSSAFEDAIISGESFRDVLSGLADDVARLIIRQNVTDRLANGVGDLIEGGAFGDLLGSIFNFGGARANGGPVSPGQAYLVGERGPEMFVPGTPGNIVPHAGGVTIVNNNDFRGVDGSAIARIEAALAVSEERALGRLRGEALRGGPTFNAIRQGLSR